MKINKKSLELIEMGLSSNTVSKLTESQISVLHKKMIGEAITQQTNISYNIPTTDLEKGTSVPTPPAGKKMVLQKTNTGLKATPTTEEFKESGKDNKNNPWAICRKQLGPRKNAKFESCVKQVKKSLKEGKNPISLFLENKIMQIVESHLPPRITKQDLVQYLSEQNPATAPVKEPKTKPGTKQPPSPVKTPSHPGKNPNPGVKEAPKANKKNKEVSENSPAVAPSGPKTKPGTKQPPSPVKTPSHPGKNPNPGVKEAPKAKNIDPEEAKEKIIDTIMKMLQK
jgi:hypothetical protein